MPDFGRSPVDTQEASKTWHFEIPEYIYRVDCIHYLIFFVKAVRLVPILACWMNWVE
jgi:hypothetical protein